LPDTESIPTNPDGGQIVATDTRFFGHPLGLSTLFFIEMWERFSYYGMRALLILYMTASPKNGGLGFDPASGAIVYGLYTSSVWLLSLPGGWIADRLLGARRAVLYGGILIAAGQFCLLPAGLTTFYTGLVLIVLGTGLLKPNVSTIVGMLYPLGDHRRDAGFSIFYMGINLGATIAPFICGWLGQEINWHLGFGIAGVGMVIGIVQYIFGARNLGSSGTEPSHSTGAGRTATIALAIIVFVAAALVVVVRATHIEVTKRLIGDAFGVGLLLIAIAVFTWMIFGPRWSPLERKRAIAILVLFVAACVFWSAYEQAGSSLNLFAQDKTRDTFLGFHFPSSWLQSMNALFIIAFAPVFAWLWIRLRKREPSSPTKFALGLVCVGLGFAVLVPAAYLAGPHGKVSPMWLVVTYLFHTWGELLLSPVGLSAMTKLAPARVVSLMMGVWFLSISVGNYLGGQAASLYASLPLPKLFGAVGAFAFVAAIILFLIVKPTVRLMSGVK
jgi:proton-dependent oligopeptide transporter, POT family